MQSNRDQRNDCHQAGASILAHKNTRTHLLKDTHVEGWKHTFRAAPAGAIPSSVFAEDYTVHANNSTLALKHTCGSEINHAQRQFIQQDRTHRSPDV